MLYPRIDPVAFGIGPVQVHWYGLMYLFGFLSGWLLARRRASRCGWTALQVDDLLTLIMLGVVVGGRVGYVLFYDLKVYLADPVQMLYLWNGGMSFHGGLCGVVAACWWWARRNGKTFLGVMDFIAPLAPPGLFFGRLGNFINGELWGKATTLPWGMALAEGMVPRHPSQLYEAALEGVVLFVVLWRYASKKRPEGHVAGLFALLYGLFRILVEFVRQPDAQIGYLAFGWLTMGQILCLPLIAVGLWLLWCRPSVTRARH